jgi:23S rRNA (cytidine1920-2'-O)/16S rRNA (cytidine1409-2'-O)-methyltransferase
MGTRRRTARRELEKHLRIVRPDLDDPVATIIAGHVHVDGRVVTNPRSMVARDAAIVVRSPPVLRGETKLHAALALLDVPLAGRTALDLGAAAGGFTRALLAHGARRVFAVDAGHGQLLGSLRQDPRVANLEATNLAMLDRARVPERIDVVTMDLSYLSIAAAVVQLGRLDVVPGADLVALVKPMFELALPEAPLDDAALAAAGRHAAAGVEGAGWRVVACVESPVRGARGAREGWLHARRG